MNGFEIIDAMMPAWAPPQVIVQDAIQGGAQLTPYGEPCGPRSGTARRVDDPRKVLTGERSLYDCPLLVWNPPAQRYVRAVDPAGNLVPLTIFTARTPDMHTDDESGFATLIVGRKLREGWFIAERGQEHRDAAMAGMPYDVWIINEMMRRREVHAAAESVAADAFITKAEREYRERREHEAQVSAQGQAQTDGLAKAVEALASMAAQDRNAAATDRSQLTQVLALLTQALLPRAPEPAAEPVAVSASPATAPSRKKGE